MTGLVKYEQARAALAICVRVDEVKDIHDKAEALRAYARQANDHELETWAAEIKLRALRRLGELSKNLEKAKPGGALEGKKGGFVRPPSGRTKEEELKEAGVSKQAASRCKIIASIPEDTFEEIIGAAKQSGKPVSAKEVLKEAQKIVRTEEYGSPRSRCGHRGESVKSVAIWRRGTVQERKTKSNSHRVGV